MEAWRRDTLALSGGSLALGSVKRVCFRLTFKPTKKGGYLLTRLLSAPLLKV